MREQYDIHSIPTSPTCSIRSFGTEESFSTALENPIHFERGVLQSAGCAIFNETGQRIEGPPGAHPSCPFAMHQRFTFQVDNEGFVREFKGDPMEVQKWYQENTIELQKHGNWECDCKDFFAHREYHPQ